MTATTPAQAGARELFRDALVESLLEHGDDPAMDMPKFTDIVMARYDAALARAPAPQAPADAGEAEPTREQQIATLKALSALDALSEAWAEEINLDGMCANLAKAVDVPAAIRAMAVQAYVEGAYAGRTSHHPAPAHAAGELWCLHIIGPDDVHPAPSRAHAQKAADLFNEAFADKREMMHAVASPWPHTTASHAESVGRFIAEWMVPSNTLAAAPPPPAGGGVSEHVRRQVGKLAAHLPCMSYNDSYFGEPSGSVKSAVRELSKAVDPIYPPDRPPHPEIIGEVHIESFASDGTHRASCTVTSQGIVAASTHSREGLGEQPVFHSSDPAPAGDAQGAVDTVVLAHNLEWRTDTTNAVRNVPCLCVNETRAWIGWCDDRSAWWGGYPSKYAMLDRAAFDALAAAPTPATPSGSRHPAPAHAAGEVLRLMRERCRQSETPVGIAAVRNWIEILAAAPPPPAGDTQHAQHGDAGEGEGEMSPEFTDTSRAALAWVLWHHQGSSSKIGAAMRFALGMGQYDELGEYRLREAKRWAALCGYDTTPQPPAPARVDEVPAVAAALRRFKETTEDDHTTDLPRAQLEALCAFGYLTRRRAGQHGIVYALTDAGEAAIDESYGTQAAALAPPAEAQGDDTARLDYIERTFSGMTNRERYLPVQMIWGKGCNNRTLREACDKYMQREALQSARAGGGEGAE